MNEHHQPIDDEAPKNLYRIYLRQKFADVDKGK